MGKRKDNIVVYLILPVVFIGVLIFFIVVRLLDIFLKKGAG
jgi:hypothetical protein